MRKRKNECASPTYIGADETEVTPTRGANAIHHTEEIAMPTQATRRRFIEIMPLAGVALLAACSPKNESPPPAPANIPPAPPATTGSLPMLDEKEASALALGYVEDAARADKVKFPNFVAGSGCSNCGNYLGQSGDPAGGCKIFPGKRVNAKGWCTAWLKKA